MAKGMSFKVLMQLQTKEFQKGLNTIKKQLNGFKNFMKSAFALGSVTMFGRQMIQVGKDFEDAMARVQAVSNATTAEFQKMQKEAQKLGSTTRYTATEAANALENLTRNGMSAADATKALSSVLQLAQANSIGLADAANIVTNTLNMFNLSAKDAGKVNDVLSSTASHAATDINLLYEAMVNAAPAANVLGFSLEETASAIGALAQRGVKGSEAGTKLRIAFQKMADPKVIAKMKAQGIEIDENTMKAEGLRKTVEKLANANLSLGDLGSIFDAKSAMAVQMLTASLDDLDRLLEVTGNSAGETSRMFNQSVGSVQKELDSLKSMYEGLLISISQKTSGVVKGVVRLLQNLIINFETLGGSLMNIASVVIPLLLPKIIRLGVTFKIALTDAAAGVATLKTAMGGIITLVATLVMWVGTALVGAYNRANKAMRDAKNQMSDAKKNAAQLQREIDHLKDKIGDGSNSGTLNYAVKKAIELFPQFEDAIVAARNEAKKTGDWDKLKNTLQEIANLQNLIEKRDAQKAIVDATAQKLGNTMYSDSRGTGGGSGSRLPGRQVKEFSEKKAAREIRQYLKDRGESEERIKAVFVEIADAFGKGKDYTESYQNVYKVLADEDIPIKEDLNKWLKGYVKNAANLTGDKLTINRGNRSGQNTTADLNRQNATLHTQDSTIQAESYKKLKEGLDGVETKIREDLKDKKDAEREFNKKFAVEVDKFYDRVIDLGFDKNAEQFKEATEIYNKYSKYLESSSVSGGSGDSGGKGSKTKAEKTPKDAVKDAIDDYNEARLKLDNRLASGTITQKEYNEELDDLEDKTWEAITAISNFKDLLGELGATDWGNQMQSAYTKNRTDEGAAEIAKQFDKLGKYNLPQEKQRNTRFDYSKSKEDILQETIEVKLDYANSINNLVTDLQNAINSGEFEGIKDDAVDVLESLKTEAVKASEAADTLQDKLNLSKVITTLDTQIKDLKTSAFDTFTTLSQALDRVTDGLMNIAQIFDEDLKDSDFYKGYEAFTSVLSESIQIMEAVKTITELVSAVQAASSKQKVKSTAQEVMANQAATASVLQKAAAEGGEAAAAGASSVASIPYVGPILAVAAAASIAAAIIAAMSKFATGGIVGGSSYSGDKVIARLNSGEMVLNKGQQTTLFNAIKNGNLGGNGNGKVEFVIRGDQLVGTLDNYKRLRK